MAECYWHGSPSGDLRGGVAGIHLGTHKAATEALEARIGRPVDGAWDGTRQYGRTLLWGRLRFKEANETPTGYNADAPYFDHYATGKACFSDGSCVSKTSRPIIAPFKIVGCMSNRLHGDTKANAMMRGNLRRGTARCGYFYKNEAEDYGSISAVVPRGDHLSPAPECEGQGAEDGGHEVLVVHGGAQW